MKRIHIDFLQYLSDHQPIHYNYFNRYFLLKSRLKNDKSYSGYNLDKAKVQLLRAGLIGETSSTNLLYLTKEGRKLLCQENQIHLLKWPEKIIHYAKKYAGIISLIGFIGSVFTFTNHGIKILKKMLIR